MAFEVINFEQYTREVSYNKMSSSDLHEIRAWRLSGPRWFPKTFKSNFDQACTADHWLILRHEKINDTTMYKWFASTSIQHALIVADSQDQYCRSGLIAIHPI
jgi:hypothetical protein